MDEIRRAIILGRRPTPELRAWCHQWGIAAAHTPIRTPADSRVNALERWCVPVRVRGTLHGWIWILDGGQLPEERIGPAVEAAERIGEILYRRQLANDADAETLRLLLRPNVDVRELASDMKLSGVFTHAGPTVIVVVGPAEDAELTSLEAADVAYVARQAAERVRHERALSTRLDNTIVFLAPLPRPNDLTSAFHLVDATRQLASHVGVQASLVAGIGSPGDLTDASRSHRQARAAYQAVRVAPELGPAAAWDNLGVFRLLTQFASDETRSAVIDHRVAKLLEDRELRATAETFLSLAGDVQQTSAQLHVHRGTLYQRLARIKSRYGLDVRANADHRLITHMGLKLARLGRAPD